MTIISPNISSSPTTTALNPNAPIFVPSSYRAVEDFSDKWWALVESSPWFRDYWLSERYYDPTIFADIDDLLDDHRNDVVKGEEAMIGKKDLISLGMLKWRKPRLATETVKNGRKAPKIVNVKVSPRPIQQPR